MLLVVSFTMSLTGPWHACRCLKSPPIMRRSSACSPKRLPNTLYGSCPSCLMPNHWHFLLWPEGDHDLSDFCRWLTHTHSMRWHAHLPYLRHRSYLPGRFKAFAVESDDHLYTGVRYIERNPLRANLVKARRTLALVQSLAAESTATMTPANSLAPGRWPCRTIGWNTSTRPKPRGNSKPCGGRCAAAAHLVRSFGKSRWRAAKD